MILMHMLRYLPQKILSMYLCMTNTETGCQSGSQSPMESELNQSQNMVTRAQNANTCTKCQYVVVLLTAIQYYTVTHA